MTQALTIDSSIFYYTYLCVSSHFGIGTPCEVTHLFTENDPGQIYSHSDSMEQEISQFAERQQFQTKEAVRRIAKLQSKSPILETNAVCLSDLNLAG